MTLELCLLASPASGWSPEEERGGEGRGGWPASRAGEGQGRGGLRPHLCSHPCQREFVQIEAPPCLRAPAAPHACQGAPGEQAQPQSREVGRARLSARYRWQRASGRATRASQTSARAFGKMDGRQGDKSQRPRGEAPSRLQRGARLRVLRSHAPTEPRSACMRPAANFLWRLPQGAPAPRSADGRGRSQSPAGNIALGSKVALMAASLHPMRFIQ